MHTLLIVDDKEIEREGQVFQYRHVRVQPKFSRTKPG